MKTTKRLLSFLLTLAMMFSVIAVAVIPTAAAEESTSTAVVVVPLDGTMVGLDGNFTIACDDGVTVTVNSVKANVGWSSSFNPETGEFFLFNGANDAHACILTLEVVISGPVRSEAKVTFTYEYDETMDDVLAGTDRKQASKSVTLDVVDYAGLLKQIKAAEDLKADAYVSMEPIKAPLAAAKNALYASYDQVAVNELATALQNAIKSLKRNIDYTRLDAAIAAAEKLNKYAYEADSWAVLETELADAKAMRSAAGVTQQEVLYAAIDLEEATKNLVPASADIDLEALQTMYNEAATKVESDYEPDSWAAFVAVRDEAKAIIDANSAVSQLYVNDLLAALDKAMAALVPNTPENADLRVLIARVEGLNPADYDADSWAAFQAALDAANLAVNASLQSEIEAAYAALLAAKDALVLYIDYTELNDGIANAETLTETDYTAESWADLIAALDAAKALADSKDQAAVNAAAHALELALAKLEKVPAPIIIDYTKLTTAIAAAEALTETDYTAETWAALAAALATAKTLTESDDQTAVNDAAHALDLAVAKLEKVPAPIIIDYTKLTTAIAAAEALTEADYTAETWAAMITALNDAKDVLESADQDTVTNAAHALELAMAELEKVPAKVVVDFAALNAAIAAAEALTEADYTTESWAAVKTALDAAKALTGSDDQVAVTAAAHALELAVAKLEKKPVVVQIDYAKLNDEITAAEALTEADYTADTWAALAAALNAAKAAKESGDQRAVDAAAYELAAAVAALAKVPAPIVVDYTALNAAIAAAEALTQADYTAETWAAMTAALEAAKALVESDDQAAVTAAAHALDLAVAKLEKPVSAPVVEVDYSSLNAAISAAEALTEADYTAETWTAMTTALTAAKAALTSDDQAAVASAAQALIAAVAALRTPVVTVPGEAETIIVEPTDPFCNKGSHTVWPVLFGIFLALTVALAALIVVYLILKKKKENDDTPVVDYDIDEDVVDETEEAAEESTEDVAEEVAEETEAAEADAYADDEADTTAE